MRRVPALVLVLTSIALFGLPAVASAQEPDPARVPLLPAAGSADVNATEARWYGYESLAPDAASFLLVLGGEEADSGGMAILGVGAYALGGPIVHALNGHPGRALLSLGMRAALPLAGLLVGDGLAPGCYKNSVGCSPDGVDGAFVGGVAGIIGAMLVDDLLLANDTVPAPKRSWAPTLAPAAGGGLSFGVAGTF